MMLQDKVAVIYGAGGATGGAVAKNIAAAGGSAEAAAVDALDEQDRGGAAPAGDWSCLVASNWTLAADQHLHRVAA